MMKEKSIQNDYGKTIAEKSIHETDQNHEEDNGHLEDDIGHCANLGYN